MNTGIKIDESGIIFVAHNSDEKAVAAISVLEKMGYKTHLLKDTVVPEKPYVAVFGLGTDEYTISMVGKGGHYLRAAGHRLDIPGIVPDWALETPFRIGVFRTEDRGVAKPGLTPSTFSSSLAEVAQAFARWSPGVDGWPAPWTKSKQDEPAPTHMDQFDSWRALALQTFGQGDALSTLRAMLPKPVYSHKNLSTKPRILFLGCATSNKPHTDVASEIPTQKIDSIVQFCRRLLKNLEGRVSEVVFSTVSSDFLTHPMLRTSLHPFYYLSVAEIEQKLGKSLQNGSPVRLWDRNHSRTDAEIGESLEFAANMIQKSIVEPIANSTNIPVWSAKWADIIPTHILDDAWEKAQQVAGLGKLYRDKVEVQPSWQVLDQFDREYAFARLQANVGIYLALAQMLKENKDTIIVDFEVYVPYWVYLEPNVREIWQDEEFSVIPVPGNVKQPWTY